MNSTAHNATVLFEPPGQSQLIFNILCVVAYIGIILAAVIGNTLVCMAFCLSPALRKSPTNYFIMSLAVSDILTVTLSVPFDVEQTLLNWRWKHGSFACSLWTTMYLFVVPSSILSLLAVSVDRYKSLIDPLNRFRQARFMTRKRACVVIAALWVYSLVFALMPEMGWKLYSHNVMQGYCFFNTTLEYSVLSSVLNFVLPVIVMCILYLRIYQIAKQMRQAHKRSGMSFVSDERKKGKQRKRLHKNIKTTKNILIVVCAFFVCWMPYTMFSLVSNVCKTCFEAAPQELFTIFLILGYSNSALNPYLYAFRNKRFKETFAKTSRTLSTLRDQRLSSLSSRRSYAHTTPTLISESPCNTRNVTQPSVESQSSEHRPTSVV